MRWAALIKLPISPSEGGDASESPPRSRVRGAPHAPAAGDPTDKIGGERPTSPPPNASLKPKPARQTWYLAFHEPYLFLLLCLPSGKFEPTMNIHTAQSARTVQLILELFRHVSGLVKDARRYRGQSSRHRGRTRRQGPRTGGKSGERPWRC